MNTWETLRSGFFDGFVDGQLITDADLHKMFLKKTRNDTKGDYYWFKKNLVALDILTETNIKKTFKFTKDNVEKALRGNGIE